MKAHIEIQPMAAVRMTRKGKFKSNPAMAYLGYKEEIAWRLKESVDKPINRAVSVHMTFGMPIPRSWTPKKQAEHLGKHHQVRPDLDNLIKGLFDAANKVVWEDDNLVVRCTAEKVYAEVPGIQIEVIELF